jgi:hypothetical protein
VQKIDRPEKLELEDVEFENLLRDWKRGLRELRGWGKAGTEIRREQKESKMIIVGTEMPPYILYGKFPVWLMIDQRPLHSW